MSTKHLTEKQLQETYDAFVASGRVKMRAAAQLGINASTFKHRLDRAAAVLGVDITSAPAEVFHSAPQSRTLEEDVAQERLRQELRSSKARGKDMAARVAELEDELSGYRRIGQTVARPSDWTLTPRKAGKSEHIPVLFTSDFQVGEVVRKEETEHGYGYDVALFRRRYRLMIEKTIFLSFEHSGKDWTYPGLVYLRGGDSISGAIHEELAETDELSPVEAVQVVFEEEAAGLAKLADAFGRVEVKDCGGGNHDRTTKKPRSKGAFKNYDSLINYMLRHHFRDDPRITFQITESMDVFFNVYGKRLLLTHGDRIGSRGGMGFVGPAATVLRGAQKVIMEQAAIGRHIDMVLMGHFHVPMLMSWVAVNGSIPGYTEFAKMNRMRPEEPQQSLYYFHKEHGVVAYKPLKLTSA